MSGERARLAAIAAKHNVDFPGIAQGKRVCKPCGHGEIINTVTIDIANRTNRIARRVFGVNTVKEEAGTAVAVDDVIEEKLGRKQRRARLARKTKRQKANGAGTATRLTQCAPHAGFQR